MLNLFFLLYSFNKTWKFLTTEFDTVQANFDNVEVKLKHGRNNEALIKAASNTSSVKCYIQGRTLILSSKRTSRWNWGNSEKVKWDLFLPTCPINIQAGSSKFTIQNFLGSLNLKSGSSKIKAINLWGDTSIDCGNAQIDARWDTNHPNRKKQTFNFSLGTGYINFISNFTKIWTHVSFPPGCGRFTNEFEQNPDAQLKIFGNIGKGEFKLSRLSM